MQEDAPPDLDPLRALSGFADLLGYRLTHWEDGLAEMTMTVEARHLNRSGVMHGGVMATLLDAACGYAGCFLDKPGRRRRAFTLALNTQFLLAAQEGDRLICRARKTGGGASIFFAAGEVTNAEGRVFGRGDAVFKYRGKSGEPEGEPV